MYTLFGDGVHDDTLAIQEMINSFSEVCLPAPKLCYVISSSLELPSNFSLVLPRYAPIRLADGSNCFMLKNREEGEASQNISITGGIWDMNNLGQSPNPFWVTENSPEGYLGFGMFFKDVKGLKLSNLTLKDPVNFAVTLDTVSYFTVENIDFDYNMGNPVPVNMDGIHLNGNCHYGRISNLKGACYDDAVALNADEGSDGPISHIEISGIFAQDCHSAVRLLTGRNNLENIHIHDIYGTYYQYCVGFTKQAGREFTGEFAGISIDHVYAAKAPRHSVYQKDGMGQFALFFIERDIMIRDLSVVEFHRVEESNPFPAIDIEEAAVIGHMKLDSVHTVNRTGHEMPLIRNSGTICWLVTNSINTEGENLIVGSGKVGLV